MTKKRRIYLENEGLVLTRDRTKHYSTLAIPQNFEFQFSHIATLGWLVWRRMIAMKMSYTLSNICTSVFRQNIRLFPSIIRVGYGKLRAIYSQT